MAFGASRIHFRAAVEILSRPSDDLQMQLRLAALNCALQNEPQIDGKINYCAALEDLLAEHGESVGQVVVYRANLLNMAGRKSDAQRVLTESAQKYPADPYLLSFFQYAMRERSSQPEVQPNHLAMKMMQNASRPKETMHDDGSPANSGLVLPGQDTTGSTGESKLWLPGS